MTINIYIRAVFEYYNKLQKRILLGKKLKRESYLVKVDSKQVLKEFEEIDYADGTT